MLCGRTPRPSLELRPDDGDPIVVPGPVHTDPADIRGTGRRRAARRQGHRKRRRVTVADPALPRGHPGVRAAERCRTGRTRQPALPLNPRCCPAPCGFPPRPSRRAGFGCAHPFAWRCPKGLPPSRLAEMLRGPRLSIEADPDFVSVAWHKLLVNAVAGLMVLTGRKSGMSTAPTSPLSVAPTSSNALRWHARKELTSPTTWSIR